MGGIDGSVLKEKEGNNYDNSDSWDEHNFDGGGGKEGAEWGNNKRDKGKDEDDDEESEEEEEEGKGDASRM